MSLSFAAAAGQCTFCPRLCRHACPVETASGRESLTPRHKMVTAQALADGKPTSAETAALLWGCSDCGACESACLHGNPVGAALYAGRARAFEQGLAPVSVQRMVERFSRQLNPTGESLLAAQENATGGRVRFDAPKGAPQLILGCDVLTDAPAIARLAMSVAHRLHADAAPALLVDRGAPLPVCCGRALREAGAHAPYEQQRRRLAARFGDGNVWVLEPACLSDICSVLPKARLFSEVIVDACLEPKRRQDTVTLQLPCGVNRDPAARDSLLRLAWRVSDDVRQVPADSPFAGCCGGRGGLKEVMPEVAEQMGQSRRRELQEFRAPTVHFSTCCARQLGAEATHLLSFYE